MTAAESEKAARLEAARARVAAVEAFATALEPVPVKVGQYRRYPLHDDGVYLVEAKCPTGFIIRGRYVFEHGEAWSESFIAAHKIVDPVPEQFVIDAPNKLNALFGAWPGDESEAELLAKLKEVDEPQGDAPSQPHTSEAGTTKCRHGNGPSCRECEAIQVIDSISAHRGQADGLLRERNDLRSQLAAVTAERDAAITRANEREAARAVADKIACKVFDEQASVKRALREMTAERDALRAAAEVRTLRSFDERNGDHATVRRIVGDIPLQWLDEAGFEVVRKDNR